MKPITGAAAETLTWIRPRLLARAWEPRAGEEVVARLRRTTASDPGRKGRPPRDGG